MEQSQADIVKSTSDPIASGMHKAVWSIMTETSCGKMFFVMMRVPSVPRQRDARLYRDPGGSRSGSGCTWSCVAILLNT